MTQTSAIVFVGKKPSFLNIVRVNDAADVKRFPEDVQKAITIEESGVTVDSCEYAGGEYIPFGSYIAWEKIVHDRCPNGYNLWCKSNAQSQLDSGILEEVDGKYRLTKIVPYKAQLFTGEIPEVFAEAPKFDGQVKVEDGMLCIETPWGVSSCEAGKGFAMVYGIYGEDEVSEKYKGMLNGNILTVGTPSFEAYYRVNEDGAIVSTLKEYYESI